MKKLLALVLVVTIIMAFVATGCKDAGNDLIKVGIINLEASESGYRTANVRNFAEVFTEENGYDAKFTNKPTNDEQIQAANTYITEGVDYLLIAAAGTDGWDAVLTKAKNAGIKVFLFDRYMSESVMNSDLYEAALVSDTEKEGDMAVEWLLEQGTDLKVLHIQGQLGSAAQIGRGTALQEAHEQGLLTIVKEDTGGDSWSEDIAKQIVESAINQGIEFNVIYADNDGMARGACTAMDEAGITYGVGGEVIVIGFDCNTYALQNVLDGRWNYDGQCSPFQAEQISKWIKTLEAGKDLGLNSRIVYIEEKGFKAGVITAADVAQYGI